YPIITFRGLFGSSSEIYITSSNTDYSPSPTLWTKSSHRHESDKSNPIKNSILLQTETDSFLKHLYFWKNSNYPDASVNSGNFHLHQNVPRWASVKLCFLF